MAIITGENLEQWLRAKQKYMKMINEGSTVKSPLPRGQIIKTQDDFKLVRQGVYHPDSPIADVTKAVASPIDLGTALSAVVFDYPAALQRKAEGGHTSVFRLYGEPGVGKSRSSRIVLQNLIQLHRVADEAVRGNIKKDDAIKTIAKTASHVFSPYVSFVDSQKAVDWNKWASDLVDSAAKYGKWQYASVMSSNIPESMNANNYVKVYSANRAYSESFPGERQIRIRNAIQSLAAAAQADDALVNTDTKSTKQNLTDLIDMLGEESMPTASFLLTENVKNSVVDKHNEAFKSSPGRGDRMGVGVRVNTESAMYSLQPASMRTLYQMTDDLINATVLKKLHTALFDKDVTNRNQAISELKRGLEVGEDAKQSMQKIDTVKRTLLDMTGNDEEKASKFLKNLADGTLKFLSNESVDDYRAVLKKADASKLMNVISDKLGGVFGASVDQVNKFQKSIGNLLGNLGHDFKNNSEELFTEDQHTAIDNDKELSALLGDAFDDPDIKKALRKKAGKINPDKVREANKKEGEKLEKEAEKKSLLEKTMKNKKEVKSAIADENKQYGKTTVADKINTEANWDELMQSQNRIAANELFDFAKVLQNSKICVITKAGEEIPESERKNHIEVGSVGDSKLFVNMSELANSRIYKQWTDIRESNIKYLGEDKGRAMTREMILGAHGPSLASHVLLNSLGLYEGNKQRKEVPFFEQFGSLKEQGLDFKDKYSENDIKKVADLLNSLSGSAELKKFGAGQDSVDAEYTKQMNNLLNKDGSINESVNKSLQGFEVMLDIVHKHSGDILKHLNSSDMSANAFVGSLKDFAEKEGDFEFTNMDKQAKQAVEKRKNKNCKKGSNSLMEGAKTISPNILKSNPANVVLHSANERAKRLLGIGE